MTVTRPIVADILDKAADTIEANGHHKGDLYRKSRGRRRNRCQVCAFGAINIAVHGSPLHPDQYAVTPDRPDRRGWNLAVAVSAGRMLRSHLGVTEVHEWNDAADRTAADVTAAMRATAARLRAGDL
ncbi:hypothetical protein [Streptomyces scopuliridis]|uniref:DUF6197 family protein n=1 Tax=Streptomyces scopuliridis TaxID=452529 RepID=UPI0036D1827E